MIVASTIVPAATFIPWPPVPLHLVEQLPAQIVHLKQVALRMHTRDSAELRLHKKGPGPVTAGDIQTDHDIEVVNPDLVIANLTSTSAAPACFETFRSAS